MRPTLVRYAFVAGLAASIGGVACSRAVQSGDSGPPVLTFTNESLDVITVYAMRQGGDGRRIASVMPGRTETLSLPTDLANTNTVTIVAVPIAGRQAASSGPISIGPGVRLAFRLNPSGNVLSVLPAPTP